MTARDDYPNLAERPWLDTSIQMRNALDEIDQLREENDKLRAQLDDWHQLATERGWFT